MFLKIRIISEKKGKSEGMYKCATGADKSVAAGFIKKPAQ